MVKTHVSGKVTLVIHMFLKTSMRFFTILAV